MAKKNNGAVIRNATQRIEELRASLRLKFFRKKSEFSL